jgi:putative copper export protein
MDVIYLTCAAALWGGMALLVWGLRKRCRARQGGRP